MSVSNGNGNGNGNGIAPADYPGRDPAPDEISESEYAPEPWQESVTMAPTEAARWWHPDHRLYVVIRRGMDEGSEPDWFSVFVELPNGTIVTEENSAPQERHAHRVAMRVLRRLADGGDLPESIRRGIKRTVEGTEATATDTDEDWPGIENPRRNEAWQDLQTYGQNYDPADVIEAAMADSRQEAYVGFDQRDFGLFQSAVDNFGIEFVIDAVFSVAGSDRVDGKTAAEWKREAGSGRPTEPTVPVYPEAELPQEVNGWQLVGTRPSRVVYRSPDEHPLYDDGRRIYLEVTKVQDPRHRKQESNQHPWGIRRESRGSRWTRASNTEHVASLLDSQDEAVDELLTYMERWPPRPHRGPNPSEWPTQLALTRTVHVALQDVIEAGEYGTDRPVDALQQRLDEFRQDFDVGGKLLTPDRQQITAEQRLQSGKQLTLVFAYLKMLHPEILANARDRVDAGDVGKLPFEHTRGEWQGALSPDESGPSGTQADLSGGTEGQRSAGPRRAENVREDPERGQRTLGAAGEKDLREFGEGGETPQEAADRRKRRREERRRREVEARREAGSQVDLTGGPAGDRQASRKDEQARRAESRRPEEGLTSWVGPDAGVDVDDEEDEPEVDFETADVDRSDREEREWSGPQKRSVADADFYALHFHGGVSIPSTNQLLNKYQSASRVINWAKKKPNRLLDLQGIGQRTVDRLAELDPDETIKSPRERGTREDTLRKHGEGPEGEGLAEFEDVPLHKQEAMERKREDAERRKKSMERRQTEEANERREEYARQAATGNYELMDALDVAYWWEPKDGFEGRSFAVKKKRNDDPGSWGFKPPSGVIPGYQSTFEEAVDDAARWMENHPAEPEGGRADQHELGAEAELQRRTIVLVGCGSEKADTARAAKDLYTSSYFSLKRQYAERFGDDWYILSAKHYLLDPDAEIAPYDKNLGDLSQSERGQWAFRIRNDLEAEFDESDDLRFVLLAGKDYTDEVWPHIDALGWDVVRPLQTNDLGGIGEQMAWLKEQVAAADVDVQAEPESESLVDVEAGDVVADSAGERYEVKRIGPKSGHLGAVVELRSEQTGQEQLRTHNELQSRFRHAGWVDVDDVEEEPDPAGGLVTVDGEASHGKDAWSAEVPRQAGAWELKETSGGDRVVWTGGGRSVSVFQTRDGWYATWSYRTLPGGVTTDGTWRNVDLATGDHTDRDNAEKLPLDDALGLALEVLREMEPADLTHPEFPTDIPVYLPPDEGDTVLDMPTYRHREFDAPADAFRLEHVTLSRSRRQIRWERDPDVLEDKWKKETIEAIGPKGRAKTGWTLRYVRVHDHDGTTTKSPETIQDWSAEEWVDLSESASRKQAYFGAAELAEMALARETPGDDSDAGAAADVSVEPPHPWRIADVDEFEPSREGYPERSFVAPALTGDSGRVPHVDVYREGTDYRVKKVHRGSVGGEERSSIWLPTEEPSGERFDTVDEALAFAREYMATEENTETAPDRPEENTPENTLPPERVLALKKHIREGEMGPLLMTLDLSWNLTDNMADVGIESPRGLLDYYHESGETFTGIHGVGPKADEKLQQVVPFLEGLADVDVDVDEPESEPEPEPPADEEEAGDWWRSDEMHYGTPPDTTERELAVELESVGVPRLMAGWERVHSKLASVTELPDHTAVWQSPATETDDGEDAVLRAAISPRKEQPGNWWFAVGIVPYSGEDTDGVHSDGPHDTATDAFEVARAWMQEHPADEAAREYGGADVGGGDDWPSAVAYLREHYGESYGSRGEFTADLGRFASEEGLDLPSEAGSEGVTQPLLRYQNIPPADVARQIENKVDEATAAAVQTLIIAFANAGASRYDSGAATDGGRRVDGRDGNGMTKQSRSRWQRIQDEARRAVEDLGVGPNSIPSERERHNGERPDDGEGGRR